jgi:hypothetical protein
MSLPEIKVCGREGCDQTFTRDRATEGLKRWALRKYCDAICASKARQKPAARGSKAQHAVSIEPARKPWREVGGVFRPHGFPDQPHIPAHLQRSAS